MRRLENFAKSPPWIWLELRRTNLRWRLCKILCLSQNIRTLRIIYLILRKKPISLLVLTADTTIKKTAYKKLKKHPQKYSLFFFITIWVAQTAEEFIFQNVAYRPTVNKTGVGIYSGSREASRNNSLALLIHWWPPCIIFKATVNVVHIHIHLQTKIHTYMPKRYCTMCYKGPPD